MHCIEVIYSVSLLYFEITVIERETQDTKNIAGQKLNFNETIATLPVARCSATLATRERQL